MIVPWRDALCRVPNFGCRQRGNFRIVLIALGVTAAFAENPEMAIDKMTEVRAFRDHKITELRAHRRQFHPEQTAGGAAYPRIFSCTIYYTPTESGFITKHGFGEL